jgi:hypothetical protein
MAALCMGKEYIMHVLVQLYGIKCVCVGYDGTN